MITNYVRLSIPKFRDGKHFIPITSTSNVHTINVADQYSVIKIARVPNRNIRKIRFVNLL